LIFARQNKCFDLGLFADQQRAFEHKPWVESAVVRLGIPTLGWKYLADEDQMDADKILANGPVVVRPSRGSGGSGMAIIHSADELKSQWPSGQEFFVSISPYCGGCLPLNVGAVVWDETVTIHHLSVQLIGVPYCVSLPFGYCGNDFDLPKSLEKSIIEQIELITVRLGDWLRSGGYRGAYGVDFLLDGGKVVFTEINARFQGSTRLSCLLSVNNDEPCLLLDHIAALLHLQPSISISLMDKMKGAAPASHIVIHNTSDGSSKINTHSLSSSFRKLDRSRRIEVQVGADTICDPGAIMACTTINRSVTHDGYSLHHDIENVIASALSDQCTTEVDAEET
jgi:formate-dependent phosphoribosylglycinamide formyltransferase (GAR transformylase)